MEPEKFEAQLKHIKEQYGEGLAHVIAKRDQAIASLFEASGWTQQAIADKVGKDRSYVARQLLFGRFLRDVPNGHNVQIPSNLTERRFRSYWEQTTAKKEQKRFEQVLELMEDDCMTVVKDKPKPTASQIIELFADSNWHTIEEIAKKLEREADDVNLRDVLRKMHSEGRGGAITEERAAATGEGSGRTLEYRIEKAGDSKGSRNALLLAKQLIDEVRSALHIARDVADGQFHRGNVVTHLMKIERKLCEILGKKPMKPKKRVETDSRQVYYEESVDD
jgi:transcriptional regulator with XRE-family HTH domain